MCTKRALQITTCATLALLALAACRKPPTWSDPATHKIGFMTANGVRLQYLDWGGSGPALILIHSYGDNPHAFDDLAPAFTDRFRVIAYAQRGHGNSEVKGPYDTATMTEDLRAFMDSLGIAKANLAGWCKQHCARRANRGNSPRENPRCTSKKPPRTQLSSVEKSSQNSGLQGINRRKYPRIKVNYIGLVRHAEWGEEFAQCEDISRGGLRFKSTSRYVEQNAD